jgi:TatD DNase family protein
LFSCKGTEPRQPLKIVVDY